MNSLLLLGRTKKDFTKTILRNTMIIWQRYGMVSRKSSILTKTNHPCALPIVTKMPTSLSNKNRIFTDQKWIADTLIRSMWKITYQIHLPFLTVIQLKSDLLFRYWKWVNHPAHIAYLSMFWTCLNISIPLVQDI